MQPTTLLALITAASGLASAGLVPKNAASPGSIPSLEQRDLRKRDGCFATGERIGDYEDVALDMTRKVCEDSFTGRYDKDEVQVECRNIPSSNKHIEFKVGLKGHNAGSWRDLGADECYDGLHKEIYFCPKGGETTYGNWYYRADPNKGPCP